MQFGRKIQSLVVGAVLLSLFGIAAHVQAQGLETTVIPSPDPLGGLFGGAVSLSADGQTALVGSLNQGRAYVFVHNGGGWALETRLPVAGPSASGFGNVVALSADGTVALVADPNLQVCPGGFTLFPCGTVYIFVRSGGTWALADQLSPPSFFDFEFNFGNALALSADGSIVLVGRRADDCVHQPCRGVVFAYERAGSTWNLVDTLRASNPSVQLFGVDVSLTPDGSTALIGAPSTPCAAGSDCGEAYVFTRNGGNWSEQAKLTAADATSLTFFGTAVRLSADGLTALIGEIGRAHV